MSVESTRVRHAQELFAPLGPRYDRMGAMLSFGQDPRWRRFMVDRLPRDDAAGEREHARGQLHRQRAGLDALGLRVCLDRLPAPLAPVGLDRGEREELLRRARLGAAAERWANRRDRAAGRHR